MRPYYATEFRGLSVGIQDDGTITSGTAGEANHLSFDGVPWQHFVIGTQTLLVPTYVAGNNNAEPGISMSVDQTNNEGYVLTPYANHSRSPLTFIIGTSPAFFTELRVRVADVGGCGPLVVGFHGSAAGAAMEAHEAAFADYTDKATIGISVITEGGAGADTGDVQTVTALNDTADITTDTAVNAVDDRICRFRVNVSSTGVVTYRIGLGGVAGSGGAAGDVATTVPTLVTPGGVVAYTFDTGDYVVPIIYFTHAADIAGSIEYLRFECGLQ